MNYTAVFITGIPYSGTKTRGRIEAAREWTDAVIEATRLLDKVVVPCLLKVTFLLPPDKFPRDFPYGPDLDNLLKRLFDALGETVFSGTPGGDSCVIAVHAHKTRVDSPKQAGAHVELFPLAQGNASAASSACKPS